MSKYTKAELLLEMERLEREVQGLRIQMENSLKLMMDTLDRAQEEVARHLRTLKIEDGEPRPEDEVWV